MPPEGLRSGVAGKKGLSKPGSLDWPVMKVSEPWTSSLHISEGCGQWEHPPSLQFSGTMAASGDGAGQDGCIIQAP